MNTIWLSPAGMSSGSTSNANLSPRVTFCTITLRPLKSTRIGSLPSGTRLVGGYTPPVIAPWMRQRQADASSAGM